MGWLLLGVVYLSGAVWWFWQLLHQPRHGSLTLHEHGLRLKNTTLRFDELERIRFGRDLSAAEAGLFSFARVLGKVSARAAVAAEAQQAIKDASLTAVFKNGETRALNGVLIRPVPDDLKRLVARLNELRPELLEDVPISAPVAPGLDELPFRMTPN